MAKPPVEQTGKLLGNQGRQATVRLVIATDAPAFLPGTVSQPNAGADHGGFPPGFAQGFPQRGWITRRAVVVVVPGHMAPHTASDVSAIRYTRDYQLAFAQEPANAGDSAAPITKGEMTWFK